MAIKEEIDSNTVSLWHFNIPLTSMNRSSRQKIKKKTEALSDTLDQIDIFIAFHPMEQNIHSFHGYTEHFPRLNTP